MVMVMVKYDDDDDDDDDDDVDGGDGDDGDGSALRMLYRSTRTFYSFDQNFRPSLSIRLRFFVDNICK